jgi:hypothetical protein
MCESFPLEAFRREARTVRRGFRLGPENFFMIDVALAG